MARRGTGLAPTRMPEMTVTEQMHSQDAPEPSRCVIVVDAGLPAGRAANAAAVIALTMGRKRPELAGADLVDGAGVVHPGLISIGISILGATGTELAAVRAKALARGIEVVDFPAQGQETTDYAQFSAEVSRSDADALRYVGVGLYGPRKAVGKIVGKYALLR